MNPYVEAKLKRLRALKRLRTLPRPLSDQDQEEVDILQDEVDTLLYDALVHHTPAEVTAAIAAGASFRSCGRYEAAVP